MNTAWAPVITTGIIAALIVVLSAMFRGALYKIIAASTQSEFHWGNNKVILKSSQSERLLASAFDSMKPLIDTVPKDERQRILTAIQSSPRPLRVDEIFPGFTRETHKDGLEQQILRNLREAQLIRPVGGGRWHGDSLVDLKEFGRIMLDYMGDYILGSYDVH